MAINKTVDKKCLNPFDIRATAWTERAEGGRSPCGVLIPLISGQPLGRGTNQVSSYDCLNPFDIRATAWTMKSTIGFSLQCLNPFDIRATAWTPSASDWQILGRVLIPLISGQPLGLARWAVFQADAAGLNPFDIRATAWTQPRRGHRAPARVLIPLISGQPLGHMSADVIRDAES